MTGGDRIKAYLLSFIRAALPRIDYYALYRARVSSQSADKTRVGVVPDDARIPAVDDCPIRHGAPGMRVAVDIEAGAHVLLGWENGDPKKPYVALWERGATLTLLELGGTTPLARLGDEITVTLGGLQTALDARYALKPGPAMPLTAAVIGAITSASDVLKGA